MTIVRDGAQSAEAQGRGKRANEGRWQAAEGEGRCKGRAKTRLAAGRGAGSRGGPGHGRRQGGQVHGKGKGAGSGRGGGHTRKAKARAAARRVQGKVKGTDKAAGGRRRTGARDQGQGRDPRARREAATRATADRDDGAQSWEGVGREKGTGRKRKEGGRAPQRNIQAVRCIPAGIQQMPAHHAHYHHRRLLYNIDPSLGVLVPCQLPRHQASPHGGAPHDPASAVRDPRAEPAPLPAAPAAQNSSAKPARMAAAPMAQKPRTDPARELWGPRVRIGPMGAGLGRRPRPPVGRDPVVLEVLGRLNWVTSGYKRNRPFNVVLLEWDEGNEEVTPAGWVAQKQHERVLCTVIQAGTSGPGAGQWPAFLEGDSVLRVRGAEANVWLLRALRAALIHWRYRLRNPPPPQPQPQQKRNAGEGGTHGRWHLRRGGFLPSSRRSARGNCPAPSDPNP